MGMRSTQYECATYFESDVLISNSYLKLLLADDVFLGPIRIILPEKCK
jgi:hypothetical protein